MTGQHPNSHPDAPQPRAVRRAATRAERDRAPRRGLPRRLRVAIFAVLAVVVGGIAVGLVVIRLLPPGATDVAALQVHASMGGFDPMKLSVKAGQPVKIELASMDTAFHSDGGGWHQFAVADLGIDWKVGPESSQVFEFTAPGTAGTYTYYCDICCGGKENPSMRGTLTVTA